MIVAHVCEVCGVLFSPADTSDPEGRRCLECAEPSDLDPVESAVGPDPEPVDE